MNIEIAERKAKRRAKTEAWRQRTGKQKPMDGAAFVDGEYIGQARRVYLSKSRQNGKTFGLGGSDDNEGGAA